MVGVPRGATRTKLIPYPPVDVELELRLRQKDLNERHDTFLRGLTSDKKTRHAIAKSASLRVLTEMKTKRKKSKRDPKTAITTRGKQKGITSDSPFVASHDSSWMYTPVKEWSTSQCCHWIRTLGLSRDYENSFRKAGMTGKRLITMGASDWQQLGVACFGDLKILQQTLPRLVVASLKGPFESKRGVLAVTVSAANDSTTHSPCIISYTSPKKGKSRMEVTDTYSPLHSHIPNECAAEDSCSSSTFTSDTDESHSTSYSSGDEFFQNMLEAKGIEYSRPSKEKQPKKPKRSRDRVLPRRNSVTSLLESDEDDEKNSLQKLKGDMKDAATHRIQELHKLMGAREQRRDLIKGVAKELLADSYEMKATRLRNDNSSMRLLQLAYELRKDGTRANSSGSQSKSNDKTTEQGFSPIFDPEKDVSAIDNVSEKGFRDSFTRRKPHIDPPEFEDSQSPPRKAHSRAILRVRQSEEGERDWTSSPSVRSVKEMEEEIAEIQIRPSTPIGRASVRDLQLTEQVLQMKAESVEMKVKLNSIDLVVNELRDLVQRQILLTPVPTKAIDDAVNPNADQLLKLGAMIQEISSAVHDNFTKLQANLPEHRPNNDLPRAVISNLPDDAADSKHGSEVKEIKRSEVNNENEIKHIRPVEIAETNPTKPQPSSLEGPSGTEPSHTPPGTNSSNTEPRDTQRLDTKPLLDVTPLDTLQSDTRPSDTKPLDTEPLDTQPKPLVTSPLVTKPSDTTPSDTNTPDTTPPGTKAIQMSDGAVSPLQGSPIVVKESPVPTPSVSESSNGDKNALGITESSHTTSIAEPHPEASVTQARKTPLPLSAESSQSNQESKESEDVSNANDRKSKKSIVSISSQKQLSPHSQHLTAVQWAAREGASQEVFPTRRKSIVEFGEFEARPVRDPTEAQLYASFLG